MAIRESVSRLRVYLFVAGVVASGYSAINLVGLLGPAGAALLPWVRSALIACQALCALAGLTLLAESAFGQKLMGWGAPSRMPKLILSSGLLYVLAHVTSRGLTLWYSYRFARTDVGRYGFFLGSIMGSVVQLVLLGGVVLFLYVTATHLAEDNLEPESKPATPEPTGTAT